MEQQSPGLRNAGFATFFFSGICSIRAGMVVSLLQERYGFAYGMTGSLLSLLSIGNLLAGFLIESGSAETIAHTIVKKMGSRFALLAIILPTQ